ncbi:hypothetical protein M0813_11113 [Anaeramoeba flamelloides]|uniref:Uncharacterized protein n=1 Tax=Anaeramoeba flamelloides TaxID=1746091 RepID=A0ABQ8ZFN9_9EUKA|nr:hypothetical protein M0813_11113 [Anaeramoeba flamelloides]
MKNIFIKRKIEIFIQIRGSTLTDALDLSDSIYVSTNGSEVWFEQTQDFYYGGSAAQSGAVKESSYSTLEIELKGMGDVSFYWKVDSEEESDYLMFSVDDDEVARISGQKDWTEYNYKIDSDNGTHYLSFQYSKDYSLNEGEDCGRVDKLVFDRKIIVTDIALDEAVDNTALTFTTGGDADWFGQNMKSFYDDDSAQSGSLNDEEQSWMETKVTGTGTVKFYWKVDSKRYNDYLEFEIDDYLEKSISGDVDWEQYSHNILTGDGEHTLRWRYTRGDISPDGLDCGWVDKIEFEAKEFVTDIALDEALDNTDLTFTTGGDAEWFGQNMDYYYGDDAIESGNCNDEEESWFETTVPSNGTVSFYWKIDSEERYDFLVFYIDDQIIDRISGHLDWEEFSYSIFQSGEHKLKWVYTKDEYDSEGEDCGWVDKLAFDPNHFSENNNIPLNYAIDTEDTDIYSDSYGHAEEWFGQQAVSYYGGDAAQSGHINTTGETVMRGYVYSVGTISFYCKVDPGSNSHFEFYLDRKLKMEITEKTDWTKYSFLVTEDGDLKMEWKYTREEEDEGEAEDCAWVDKYVFIEREVQSNISLDEALDNSDLTFITGGDADWIGQNLDYYYGEDSARSGKTNHSGESWIETTVNGGGEISFYWKVDSEEEADYLEFSVDGVVIDQISGYQDWIEFVYTIPDPGEHDLEWNYVKDSYNTSGKDRGWVDKVSFVNDDEPTISLSEALDNTDLTFTSGGDAKWYGQDEVSYSGDDSAKSGRINADQTTWFETTISGKGTLTFHWKVDSLLEVNYLRLYLDDEKKVEISGDEDWAKQTLTLTEDGEHNIQWSYEKFSENQEDSDCAWVDKIEFDTDSDSDNDNDDDTVSLGNNILFPFALTFFTLLSFFFF